MNRNDVTGLSVADLVSDVAVVADVGGADVDGRGQAVAMKG